MNGRVIAIDSSGNVVALQSSSPTSTTLASGASVGAGASLSPDATKLAYSDGTTIHVVCIVGSCTGSTFTGKDPAWSPDGTKIAYVSGSHVWEANTDGTSAVDLTPGATDAEEPAWSPDGTKVAFATARSGGLYEIWAVNVGTLAETQVTSNTGTLQDREPAWSPNGSTIAFQANRSSLTTTQIYTVSAGGGSVTQITNGTADQDPVWSPDSTKIAFVQGHDIATVASSGGSTTTLASYTSTPETVDWETLVPTNSVAPTVSAATNPIEGNVVTASRGTWSGASSYLYQFQRCDSDGFDCQAIGSQSSSASYTLTADDVGHTIRVEVAGVDSAGAANGVRSSNATAVVLGPGPTNIDPPTISLGTNLQGVALTQPHVGNYVTATIGSWTGTGNTYTYQWKKCDPKTTSCYDLAGATSSFYLPTNDVYGWDLRVQVTAKNDDGSNSMNSAPTDVVTADPPVSTSTPPIVGQNTQGQTLRVTPGTWTGTAPLVFTYQWKRCDPQGTLSSCVAIPGATTTTYTLGANDVGVALRAYITATNVTGSVTIFTNHTFPTLPVAAGTTPPPAGSPKPANTARPTIAGTATVGTSLLAAKGTWSGKTPIVYRYAWQRCDALGSGCRPIETAHKATYVVRSADLGYTLRVAVTASNKAGKGTALSIVTAAVALGKPVPRPRHIVGTNKADYLAGGGGNDTILGRGGNDTILGGAGDDLLEGGPGNDVIDGGPGADRIIGGPGSDTIYAADGIKDTIDCGPGRDHAIVDKIDVVKNCELITYGTPPTTATAGGGTSGTTGSEERVRR